MVKTKKKAKKAKQPTTIVGVRLTQETLDLLDRLAEDLAENVPIPRILDDSIWYRQSTDRRCLEKERSQSLGSENSQRF